MKKGQKIAIFGGYGFMGSWLVNLLKADHDVVTFDIQKNYNNYDPERIAKIMRFRKELLSGAKHQKGDVRDLSQVEKFLNREKPDIIVFLASIPFANFADRILQFSVEPTGMSNVLRVNEKINARIVFMSSLFATGDFDHVVSEVTPLEPRTTYGIGKATCEHLLKSFSDNYGIVRTTSVYGAGDINNRVPQIIIEKALTDRGDLLINKTALLDFTYIKDLVNGIKQVAFYKGNEVFNIAGGRAMTLIDFIKAVEVAVDKKLQYKTHSLEDRMRRGSLANDKARLVLKWEPQFDLASGVKDTVNIYKEKIRL